MPSLINIIFYFFFQILTGYVFLLCFDLSKNLNILEVLSISYGIGMGFTSLFIFLFNFDFLFAFLFLIFLSTIIFIINRNRIHFNLKLSFRRLSKSEFAILVAILSIVIYVFFLAVTYPIESRDTTLIWGLKAKAIYIKSSFPLELLKEPDPNIFHLDYPLLVPIQEALFYNFLGRFDDALVKIIFVFWYLSFLVIFYFVLRRFIERKYVFIFILFFVSIFRIIRFVANGYTDFVMAFYFSLGFIFLYTGYIKEEGNLFYLVGIFSSIAAWVKNEGLIWGMLNLILLVILMLLYYFKDEEYKFLQIRKSIIFYLIMMAVFFIPWQIFRIRYGLNSDIITEGVLSIERFLKNFNRIGYISYAYIKEFLNLKNWNLVWILFIISFLFNLRNIFSKKYFLFTELFLGFFIILSIIYILTPKYLEWHLINSLSRIFIHIVPTVVLWLAVFFEDRILRKIIKR